MKYKVCNPHIDDDVDYTTCLVLCTKLKCFFSVSSNQLKFLPNESKNPQEFVSLFMTIPIQCSPFEFMAPVLTRANVFLRNKIDLSSFIAFDSLSIWSNV